MAIKLLTHTRRMPFAFQPFRSETFADVFVIRIAMWVSIFLFVNVGRFFVPLFHSTAFSLLMCLCVCVSQIDHGIGIVSYGNGAQTIK